MHTQQISITRPSNNTSTYYTRFLAETRMRGLGCDLIKLLVNELLSLNSWDWFVLYNFSKGICTSGTQRAKTIGHMRTVLELLKLNRICGSKLPIFMASYGPWDRTLWILNAMVCSAWIIKLKFVSQVTYEYHSSIVLSLIPSYFGTNISSTFDEFGHT